MREIVERYLWPKQTLQIYERISLCKQRSTRKITAIHPSIPIHASIHPRSTAITHTHSARMETLQQPYDKRFLKATYGNEKVIWHSNGLVRNDMSANWLQFCQRTKRSTRVHEHCSQYSVRNSPGQNCWNLIPYVQIYQQYPVYCL
jgi:hypothetical protein